MSVQEQGIEKVFGHRQVDVATKVSKPISGEQVVVTEGGGMSVGIEVCVSNVCTMKTHVMFLDNIDHLFMWCFSAINKTLQCASLWLRVRATSAE